jgi:hypothetical protein
VLIELRPVVGWEGLYLVSDRGDVWSIRAGRLLKQSLSGRPGCKYLTVWLARDGRGVRRPVHKLVAEAFIGPCPPGQQVRHGDGIKTHNERSNLSYGTPGDNMRDQVRHGVHAEARRDRCDNGHEYTPDNTAIYAKGDRICKTCRASRARDWRNQNPEQVKRRRREAMRRTRARQAGAAIPYEPRGRPKRHLTQERNST